MATKKKSGSLFMKREQGWNNLTSAEEKRLEKYCREYIEFLSAYKTERLVFAAIRDMAVAKGYRDLDEVNAKGIKLKAGDTVYRAVDEKTIMLLKVGKAPIAKGLNLIGGHSDCPRLDLKQCPLYQDDQFVLFDTHYYGGIKKYQWVTIPLALYGVICRKDGTKVSVAVGDKPGDPVFTISDLLPHLDMRSAKTPMSEAIPGEKLNVICGSRPVSKDNDDKEVKEKIKLNILKILNAQYGIEEEDFSSAELEMVPAGQARELGFDRSMILGYGHDDRICSYAAARAVLDCKEVPQRTIGALICDKEEIGSYGRTGMDSTFLPNTVAELIAAVEQGKYSDLLVRRALENTKMISADVGAVCDPDYKEVCSPHNQAKMNCGLEISKYDGARGKSGASDASAELLADVRKVFNDAGVCWQTSELGKVDVGGGGTISMYMARYGIQVVDCGVGLLCMHAPWEIAGKLDTYMAYKGYSAFLYKIR